MNYSGCQQKERGSNQSRCKKKNLNVLCFFKISFQPDGFLCWAQSAPASLLPAQSVSDDTPTDMIASKHQQPLSFRHTHQWKNGLCLILVHTAHSQSHPFLWQPWWITRLLFPLIKGERGDGHTPGAWLGLIAPSLLHTESHLHNRCLKH